MNMWMISKIRKLCNVGEDLNLLFQIQILDSWCKREACLIILFIVIENMFVAEISPSSVAHQRHYPQWWRGGGGSTQKVRKIPIDCWQRHSWTTGAILLGPVFCRSTLVIRFMNGVCDENHCPLTFSDTKQFCNKAVQAHKKVKHLTNKSWLTMQLVPWLGDGIYEF